jgi:hypothetical protein
MIRIVPARSLVMEEQHGEVVVSFEIDRPPPSPQSSGSTILIPRNGNFLPLFWRVLSASSEHRAHDTD